MCVFSYKILLIDRETHKHMYIRDIAIGNDYLYEAHNILMKWCDNEYKVIRIIFIGIETFDI